jgi:trk/ktr system potassium uptake protein
MATLLLFIGRMLVALSLLMTVPGILAIFERHSSEAPFLLSAAGTASIGGLLWFGYRNTPIRITPRLAFLLTTSAWVSASLASALPLLLIADVGVTDALFETISGITTTGATVLIGLDRLPDSLLLWRSLLQWFGGLGFVVVGVALMPVLGVGGMRLFRSENSDWSEKAMPRMQSMATSIVLLYLVLSILCALAYRATGMDSFDAINHAMTTISTGGYSTHDESFMHFDRLAPQLVAIVFMLLGSLPFAQVVQAVRGRREALFSDDQVRAFLQIIVLASALMALWLYFKDDWDLPAALVQGAFNVTSVITTTGYASAPYDQWGSFPYMVFFYLMFIGGCSGSTAGGMKVFRFQLGYRLFNAQLRTLMHPRGVFAVRFNDSVVSPEIIRSLVSFSMIYFTIIGISAGLLAALGLDPEIALTASMTAIGNVGPGLGEIIGPAGNYSSIPDAAKWVLSFDMLLGRLEIMTIMALLSGTFWRQ